MRLLLITILLWSSSALAEEAVENNEAIVKLPNVELDLEEVPGAAFYELEFTLQKGTSKPKIYRSAKTSFSTSMKPGEYALRMRSIGKDKEPGPWSPTMKINVLPILVHLLEPKDNAVLVAKKSKRKKVTFQWQNALKAESYILRIWSNKSANPFEVKTKKTKRTIELKIGREIRWEVQPEGHNGIQYDGKRQLFSFKILGDQLETPKLAKLPLFNSKKVKWEPVQFAETYDAKLFRKYIFGTEWSLFQEKINFKENVLKLNKPLTPGIYRLEVIAHSPIRISSEKMKKEFLIKPAFRSLSSLPGESTEGQSEISDYNTSDFN